MIVTSAAQFSPRHLYLECKHAHHVTGQNGVTHHVTPGKMSIPYATKDDKYATKLSVAVSFSVDLVAGNIYSVMEKGLNKFMAIDSELYQRAKLLVVGLNVTHSSQQVFLKNKSVFLCFFFIMVFFLLWKSVF